MFPPSQRPRLINLDTDDDDTQDVPIQNGQDLLAGVNLDVPPTPPGRVSPIDYLVRVESEIQQREDDEFEKQLMTPGYMRNLRDMHDDIDEWLGIDGGVAPFPETFKRFIRHNWCMRKLPRSERIRISKLRLRRDMILMDEEAAFWKEAERNELNVQTLNPICAICRFDLRNESFTIKSLSCGHTFHTRCIDRHLDAENINKRCPNCNFVPNGTGERTYLTYQ